jgi:inosine-uridine nucleoside N-ribohydrolase
VTKLLLDTDIGSDIDDAVALAYLLARPDCDLLGVTTVTGEPERRAQMVSAMCRAADREVRVYPGAAEPLLVEQRQPLAEQAAALDRWPHDTDFPRGEAVEFLRRTIRAHPGEITLLTIGPLTNVALLFRADPAVAGMLKGLVMMGGTYLSPSAGEWNVVLDPHAARIVYDIPVAVHRSVGLDVTERLRLPAADARARFTSPVLRPVLDFAEVYFRNEPEIIFHDPLAAAVVFEPGLCRFERGAVEVGLGGDRAGATAWAPATGGQHEVAVDVDPARFFEHYFGVVGQAT